MVVVVALFGPMVAVGVLLARQARAAQRRLDVKRAQIAAEFGFALEYDDAVAGSMDGHFVRIVWSRRNEGGMRGGGRPVTYCELPFRPRLGVRLALSTGWPWGGRKKKLPGIGRPVSFRCDGADRAEAILASVAATLNAMPEPLTLEVDDAAARVFGWGHAFDAADLRARLRFAIESGEAVAGGLGRAAAQR
jgi:hypothetical protein